MLKDLLKLWVMLIVAIVLIRPARGQNAPTNAAAPTQSSKIPDLSGSWLRKTGIQSISNSDIGGNKRGHEEDIPYQPWALEKTMSEKPPTGPDNQFDQTTDPWILYCKRPGLLRVYMGRGVQSSCRPLMLSTSCTR